jgi:hypothetical protein
MFLCIADYPDHIIGGFRVVGFNRHSQQLWKQAFDSVKQSMHHFGGSGGGSGFSDAEEPRSSKISTSPREQPTFFHFSNAL